MTSNYEEEPPRRDYIAPYSDHHPIPTVQRYREHQSEVVEHQKQAEESQHTQEDDPRTKRVFDSAKAIIKGEDKEELPGNPYPTANRHVEQVDHPTGEKDSSLPGAPNNEQNEQSNKNEDTNVDTENQRDNGKGKDVKHTQSATEKAAGRTDPRQKRKDMKHNKRDDGGRVVTDPVTHLPLVIRDSTEKDMKRAPPNESSTGAPPRTETGMSAGSKSPSQLDSEKKGLQGAYEGMQQVFPTPDFEDTRLEIQRIYLLAFSIGLGVIAVLATLMVSLFMVMHLGSRQIPSTSSSWFGGHSREHSKASWIPLITIVVLATTVGLAVITGLRGWLGKKIQEIWDDEVWDSARAREERENKTDGQLPESTAWMNALLASIWPLINPDLFASIVDMLEDVMQASLPKMIRMISVEDMGQGSESIRILGIRSLPTGAAGQTVDEKGNIKKGSKHVNNDRKAPGQGEEEDHEDEVKNEDDPDAAKKEQSDKQKEVEQEAIREGMEAEQGDFVNMELAFAYRARSSGKTIKSKAKNAHLYLKFYLPGGIFVPVWVELRGLIGTMRLRLQLTPDPPFFSLCTLTFLGQPRADLSCVPLSKHLPNLMNVPLISSFVQSSIDAALAEYVAPKSLTLDLKDMLVGDDFKKDTVARGVIAIFIKEAKGFKEGDGGVGPMKGSSDSYVTCSWAKFGKTISSTRIIEEDQHPVWHEWAYMLVTPDELNAEEKLRLQLWDSDKYTADDDLGRVEVDLKELMHNEKTKNRMCEREDRLMGQDADEKMPGTISWSVGYYTKVGITDEQLADQTYDEEIRSKEDLKIAVSKSAERKLREARSHDEHKELDQQKAQDYKEHEDALLCASPPTSEYISGVLSIQIHNVTGLEISASQKTKNDNGDREDEAEQSDNLPSSYCTIILNHKKIYTTRTKPKNSKPFFNAGTERFINDWQKSEVMVSVRDRREGENDSLLGIVYLPLDRIFEKRSQVMNQYPLVGGIGFGQIRISMVFRSTEMKLPKELLGWDYGTLEIKSPIKSKGNLPQDLEKLRVKLRSNMMRAKMTAEDGQWVPKKGKNSIFLAVRRRYATPLIIEFRKSKLGPDSTPAFAVFWLKDIPDEEERTITMKVWKGGKKNLKRASLCADFDGYESEGNTKKQKEEPLGEIEVTMQFWRGLSGYHKSYANKGKNGDVRTVMEVLDTINDEMDGECDESNAGDSDDSEQTDDDENSRKPQKLQDHTNEDSSSSSDSDSDSPDSSTKNPLRKVKQKVKDIVDSGNESSDGSRGPIDQLRDYKAHHKGLHRKHRGVMQWKGVRTADWALDKVRHGKSRVTGIFEHHERGQGVETEV
jgi:hypothetical protein